MRKKNVRKATDFQAYLRRQLQKPKIKNHFDEYGRQLGIAYQILRLRKGSHLSQTDLAERIGTSQSNIARMEQGRQNFTIDTLDKIAKALNKDLMVSIK